MSIELLDAAEDAIAVLDVVKLEIIAIPATKKNRKQLDEAYAVANEAIEKLHSLSRDVKVVTLQATTS
ncbi:MAG: hypothetical protein NTW52_12180 [Planctomycetota bacterium]|nr:hypothetical protein [Planctomycetota bacterium]